ncbi:DUF1822 family protein [Synechococcales cyanobacterium C]|uniref:DUF1822 family protein n=1 Tax=Petrachloros mirabilis ULC683 TaxID=2781853 RepID=A0A8K2A033_9CYAN|nr:DUF1822 family protein [Petrachloros mirabilis]NCJ07998.1 DUF1822 family protein [Petrachloros mirabilis ULC683]
MLASFFAPDMSFEPSQKLTFPVPIYVRQLSEAFACEQPSTAKANQARKNTLAVWAVYNYLKLMGIRADLTTSDSWNPIMRWATNSADLNIQNVGRLECRPMDPEASSCLVPPEVWCDRIGYVAVALSPTWDWATLVGFTPTVNGSEVTVASLQPLSQLLDQLYALQVPLNWIVQPHIQLSQWLTGIFEAGWESVETLLSTLNPPPAYPMRSVMLAAAAAPPIREHLPKGLRRAKLMTLRSGLESCPVVLVIYIEATSSRIRLMVQVYPGSQQFTLPPELALQVIDEKGTPFLTARSQRADSYMQLQFWGSLGEPFATALRWKGAETIEHFVI